jgi:hypothetical protein
MLGAPVPPWAKFFRPYGDSGTCKRSRATTTPACTRWAGVGKRPGTHTDFSGPRANALKTTTLRSSGQAVWSTRKTDAGKMPFETPSRLLRFSLEARDKSGQVGTSQGKPFETPSRLGTSQGKPFYSQGKPALRKTKSRNCVWGKVDGLSGFPYTRFSHPARRSSRLRLWPCNGSGASTEYGVCPERAKRSRMILRSNSGADIRFGTGYE